MAALPPIRDPDALIATRVAWHALAEHALAAARYQAEGRIGLVVTPGGFGTPVYGGDRSASVTGQRLVVREAGAERTLPITTIADAADALGVAPGAPPVYTAVTELTPDARLRIDEASAGVLAAWFDLAWTVLHELSTDVTLWPEHFDAACELGDESRGERGTFGASPGDDEHPQPYLYVTHWADVPPDEYWNDTVFAGASLEYGAVAESSDPAAVARAFFERGRAVLSRG